MVYKGLKRNMLLIRPGTIGQTPSRFSENEIKVNDYFELFLLGVFGALPDQTQYDILLLSAGE